MLAIRLERKCRRVRDIKQANSDNKIRGRKGVGGVGRGQSSKSSGGVRGDDACNNIKGTIRLEQCWLKLTFHFMGNF